MNKDEASALAADLKRRYAYQFDEPNSIGYTLHMGWIERFARLCADVDTLLGDADKKRFRWVQLKEKMGSARWYWRLGRRQPVFHVDVFAPDGVQSLQTGGRGELESKLRDLVNAAMDDTAQLCIVCGLAGAVDWHDHYALVLCPAHVKQRQADGLTYRAFVVLDDDDPEDKQ
jgi:hypothetical protein